MKLVIVTSPKTDSVLPMQNYLFKKFGWDFHIHYIHNNRSINDWCKSVYNELCYIEDDIIIFGLDDFLPIKHPNHYLLNQAKTLVKSGVFDRVELNWGGIRHKNKVQKQYTIDFEPINCYSYTKEHPYTVSCQFSAWNKEVLKNVLNSVNSNPWDFEKKGRCKAGCLSEPALRYIEESALSNRLPRRVNLLGMPVKVIEELIEKGYVRESDITYGWKNHKKLTPEVWGSKYKEFYEV